MLQARPSRPTDCADQRRRGFMALEGLVASVLLAILVIGIVGSLNVAYQQSQVVRAAGNEVLLGRQLITEINAKPLADPTSSSVALGPDAGMTSRSQFTRITNYNGYSDTSDAIPMLGGGTAVDATGSESYSRTATVVMGAEPSVDTASPAASDFAIVNVQVTAPNGQIVQIPEFVARYSIQR
jgi:Tfp pilus assembly protein PilV